MLTKTELIIGAIVTAALWVIVAFSSPSRNHKQQDEAPKLKLRVQVLESEVSDLKAELNEARARNNQTAEQ